MLNAAKISVSNIIMYLLPIVVTPILSRLYGPEPFGEWGVFSSFTAIVTIGLFLGFENTIVKADAIELKNILALCFIISITIIAIVFLVFIMGGTWNIKFFSTFPSLKLLTVYLLVYSVYTLFYNLCIRYERFTSLAFTHIVLGGSQAVFRILFGFVALAAANGLILGTTIAQCLSMVFLFFCIIKDSKKWNYQIIRISAIKKLIRKFKNFPLYDAPSSILSFSAFNLPVLILALYFSKRDIGCFSIVLQLLLLPMSFVGSAIGRVYYQQLCQKGNNGVSVITNNVVVVLAVISILPLIFIACGGDKLVVLFLGAKWQNAGNVALCLSLWSFPTILTQPLIPIFRTLDKQKTLLYFDTMYFVLGIGSILLLSKFCTNLYLILTIYTILCFFVKFAMFIKILALAKLSMKMYYRFVPLWIVSLSILTFRLINLL